MWIMFRTKPLCENAPPKLSIFWSVPWPKQWARRAKLKVSYNRVNRAVVDAAWDEWLQTPDGAKYAKRHKKPPFAKLKVLLPYALVEKHLLALVYADRIDWEDESEDEKYSLRQDHPFGGMDYDWANARAIIHNDEKVRVFPEEFTPITAESMHRYIAEGVHTLVPSNAAAQQVVGEIETGLQRVLYEEALVAGCDHAQAMLTAMGQDPTEGMEFPPIGWYKCHPGYKGFFCHWDELEPEDQEWLEANPQEPMQLFKLVERETGGKA